MKKRVTIKKQLFKRIFITTTIVTIFFSIVNYIYIYRTESAKLNQKSEESITNFTKFLEIPLWNFDIQLLEKFSLLLMNEKRVCAVKIIDDTKNKIVSFEDDNCKSLSQNNLLTLRKKIYYKNNYLGEVFITYSKITVSNQLVKFTINNFLLFISLLIILLLITHNSINNFVIYPLNIINKYVRKISEGDYSQTIEGDYSYEFENIKDAFNHMVTNIQSYHEELISINKKILTLLDTIPDAVLIFNKKNEIIEINKTAEMIFGYRAEEFRNFTMKKLFGYKFERKIKYDKSLNPFNNDVKEFEIEGKNKFGKKIPLSIRVKVVSLNNVNHIMAIVTDISKRKEAEKSIISEKEKLSITLRSITDGVIVTDEKSNIIMLNKPAQSILCINEKEVYLQPVINYIEFIDDNNLTEKHPIQKVIENRKSILFAEKIKNNKGEIISVEGSCSPIMFKTEFLGTIIIIKDVTEKEKMEKEILKAQKLESLGLLAGGIAHDFNNLMTAINTFNTLIRLNIGDNEDVINYTENIEKIINSATGLTGQLLTFSKGGSPVKGSHDIYNIVEDTAKFILSGTAIKLKINKDKNLWPAYVDSNQISQVIHNIVLNAKQAMKNKGVIEINIQNVQLENDNRFLLSEGKYISIIIKDNGPGIPEEIVNNIFDPFFSTKKKGNGIGLSTVYSIIKKHNGYIEATPSDDGAIFTIILPVAEQKEQEEISDEKIDYMDIKLKILVLDDEESIRSSLIELLGFLGHKVEAFDDGKLVIEKYSEAFRANEPYDLLILDLTVPGGMGGLEALKEILKIDPNAKAIVSSGYSDDVIIADYKKFGFSEVMPKPFKLEQILQIIKNLFAN